MFIYLFIEGFDFFVCEGFYFSIVFVLFKGFKEFGFFFIWKVCRFKNVNFFRNFFDFFYDYVIFFYIWMVISYKFFRDGVRVSWDVCGCFFFF